LRKVEEEKNEKSRSREEDQARGSKDGKKRKKGEKVNIPCSLAHWQMRGKTRRVLRYSRSNRAAANKTERERRQGSHWRGRGDISNSKRESRFRMGGWGSSRRRRDTREIITYILTNHKSQTKHESPSIHDKQSNKP